MRTMFIFQLINWLHRQADIEANKEANRGWNFPVALDWSDYEGY